MELRQTTKITSNFHNADIYMIMSSAYVPATTAADVIAHAVPIVYAPDAGVGDEDSPSPTGWAVGLLVGKGVGCFVGE